MKRLVQPLAGLSLAAALLAGCTAPTTAPAGAGASASSTVASSATAAPASATAAAAKLPDAQPGAEVDKAAMTEAMKAGAQQATLQHTVMKMTVDMAGQPLTMNLEGDVDATDPAKPRGSWTMTGMMPMQVVVDGDAYYMRSEAMGNQWYRTTQQEMDASGAAPADPMELTNAYGQLPSQAQKIVFVGTDTTDGVATRHYTFHVPAQSILGDAASATEVVPYEVWLDEQGRVRRATAQVNEPKMQMEVAGSKFMEPVTITVPTDAQPFPGTSAAATPAASATPSR